MASIHDPMNIALGDEEDEIKRFLNAVGKSKWPSKEEPPIAMYGNDMLPQTEVPPMLERQPMSPIDLAGGGDTQKAWESGDVGSFSAEEKQAVKNIDKLPGLSLEDKADLLSLETDKLVEEKRASDLQKAQEQEKFNKEKEKYNILTNDKLSDQQKSFLIAKKGLQDVSVDTGVPPSLTDPRMAAAQQPMTSPAQQQQMAQQAASGNKRMVSTTSRPQANPGVYQGVINRANTQLGALGNPQEALNNVYDERQKLAEQRMRTEMSQAKAQEAAAEEQMLNAALHKDQVEKKMRERQSIMGNLMDEYNTVKNEKVELEEEGWGKKLGLALAAGLASFGSGLAGGSPVAGLDIVKQHIAMRQRKLQGMRQDKKEKMSAIEQQMNKYRQLFGDEDIALNAMRTADLETAAAEVARMAARTQNQEAKQRLAETQAQIEAERAQSELEMQGKIEDRVLRAQKQADDVTYRNQMMGMERQKLAAMSQKQGMGKQIGEKTAMSLSDQRAMYDQASKLQESFNSDTGPFSVINQFVSGTGASDYNRKADLLRDTLIRLRSGAAITESEMERMMELIPDASTFESKGNAAFDAFKQELSGTYNRRLETLTQSGYDVSRIPKVAGSIR